MEGFAVREAADGLVALKEIAGQFPAVVVLDVVMPVLDGVEVVRDEVGEPTAVTGSSMLTGQDRRALQMELRTNWVNRPGST